MQTPDIAYRDVQEGDMDFLRQLREQTMREVVERHRPWNAAEQENRLRTALDSCLIIRSPEKDIGLLKVVRRHNHIELVQLQIAPAWQGRGLGSRIVQDLQAEAAAADLPVVLHVYATSRALGLFLRLGFQVSASMEHFRGLRWSA